MSHDTRVTKVEKKLGMTAECEGKTVIELPGRVLRIGKKQCEEFIRELNEETKKERPCVAN